MVINSENRNTAAISANKNEMTPENIPMPNSSILVSYIVTKLTLLCQLFYLYPKE